MYSKTKKIISLVLFFMGMILVFSCRENPKADDKTTTTQTETATPVEGTTTTVKSANGVILNPAHGQPGHRCDISVGEPLDSKPTPLKTNDQSSDIMLDNSSSTTLPKGTLNPAHGQPGHNCAIKVGDPL